jgi:hypothetical protein
MAPSTFPTNGVHHEADEQIDQLYAWMPPQGAPQPCPEAAFSLTLKGTLDGIEALFTVRGQSAAEFKANLAAVRGLLDQPQAPPQAASQSQAQLSPQQHNALAMGRKVSGVCPVHGVQMKQNQKEGRTWYSHKTADGWCKGR